jgi:superfamily I DNA/RNA helicase
LKVGQKQCVILGPPGCGKTTRLLGLVDEHLADGTSPQRIGYFSFTKKAVNEARGRAAEKFGFRKEEMPHYRTVHSATFNLMGLTRSDVIGSTHYREIGRLYGIEFTGGGFDETTGMVLSGGKADQALFLDALSRARCVPLEQQWNEFADPSLDLWHVKHVIQVVADYKAAHGLLDFTDMLGRYAAGGPSADVDVAFIDEAQDLSQLQWRVLQRMLRDCPQVYIAGDDDQAIYRWSGADVESFLALEGHREVLAQSWRCPKAVHDLSDRIAKRITHRFPKKWAAQDREGEIRFEKDLDCLDFESMGGTSLLLARNLYPLESFKKYLRRVGLPYQDAHHKSSILAQHAEVINKWESLRKGREISGDDVKLVYDYLKPGTGVRRGVKARLDVYGHQGYSMARLESEFGLVTRAPWYDALENISLTDRTYYRAVLRSGGSLHREPKITISSIHGAKGGEADNVVVMSDMAGRTWKDYEKRPDDEHRVAYVAASRARNRLVLLQPQGKTAYNYPGG